MRAGPNEEPMKQGLPEEGESVRETETWLEVMGSLAAGRCEGERGVGGGPSGAGVGDR